MSVRRSRCSSAMFPAFFYPRSAPTCSRFRLHHTTACCLLAFAMQWHASAVLSDVSIHSSLTLPTRTGSWNLPAFQAPATTSHSKLLFPPKEFSWSCGVEVTLRTLKNAADKSPFVSGPSLRETQYSRRARTAPRWVCGWGYPFTGAVFLSFSLRSSFSPVCFVVFAYSTCIEHAAQLPELQQSNTELPRVPDLHGRGAGSIPRSWSVAPSPRRKKPQNEEVFDPNFCTYRGVRWSRPMLKFIVEEVGVPAHRISQVTPPT